MDKTSPNLIIKQLEIGPLENFVYLIADRETKEGIVIDPAWETEEIIREAELATIVLSKIFVTHIHPDHINAAKEIVAYYPIEEVYVHNLESPYINDPSLTIISTFDEDEITLGTVTGSVVHTPGHSPGSQCLYIDGVIFTGDTLFVDACGRADLPGGDIEDLYYSLNERLKNLPEDTVVYPGHNYGRTKTSTIKQEKQNNIFLSPTSLDDFLKLFQSF
ncbi:MAG: MBL fold metallo-hydrolase [Candidatus Omnitrophica bacterium]|nr:MBL fold metallo-hydrolase [Candidatus Omnitrophota bacterium]